MKRDAILIRLHRNHVDEKRRVLADLERMRDTLVAQTEALEEEIRSEQEIAASSFEAGARYGAYAALAVTRRETVKRSIEEIDHKIMDAKDEVLEAFRTLKKHEVARDLRLHQERKAADQREQDRLDDIALNNHRRRDAD